MSQTSCDGLHSSAWSIPCFGAFNNTLLTLVLSLDTLKYEMEQCSYSGYQYELLFMHVFNQEILNLWYGIDRLQRLCGDGGGVVMWWCSSWGGWWQRYLTPLKIFLGWVMAKIFHASQDLVGTWSSTPAGWWWCIVLLMPVVHWQVARTHGIQR